MRRDFRRLRRAAAAAGGADAAAALAAEAGALATRLPRPPQHIAGYVAAGGEIDVLPLLVALGAATGAGLCLPVVTAPDTALDFRVWQPDAPLVAGAFGILMPEEAAGRCLPDLLLMPLVAVDRAGRRLGQGGGFYDRTLAAADAAGRMPLTIGVCFAIQLADEVPAGPLDRPLDLILTERGLLVPIR
ncbi:5-formyltetrahydrofolate cyclo-ligase [Tistrella mobilis]|uniref:5-formyltetrahydrofolate cyclo-ligase n=1 Tax=Tistrella mobilis TaxID=171437 RepID=UPI003557CEC6